MFKKIYLGLLCVVTFASADSTQWFMELGWKISTPLKWNYNSFDAAGLNGVHYDGKGTDDMLYISVGRLFEIENSMMQVALSGGTTFIVLDSADHNDALFAKAALLYPAHVFGHTISVGPTIQAYFPYNSYYYDSEDGAFARKVHYDKHAFYAFGFDSTWGEDIWRYNIGAEYMFSSKFKGNTYDTTGYANSELDHNGLYVHFGVQYHF